MLTVIIPSKTEKFLDQTIHSVLDNATKEVEIIISLDGYDCPRIDDPRVRYIVLPPTSEMKKRQGVNEAVKIAKGEYIMCLDAHCMVGKGFDEILAKDCEDNWIVVPRRYKLNAETWTIQDDQPPVDYEYYMWRYFIGGKGSHGFPEFHDYRWDEKQKERENVIIDDKMTMQASCWFMHKKWFVDNDIFNPKGYTGWGGEAEQICLTTWLMGGRVVVNKGTYYAHLYKGKKWGRMYFMSSRQRDASIHYAFDFWFNNRLKNRIHNLDWLIDKFWPLPNWPTNWREITGYKN
jgi:glycosyltransferase involved in cell wall biosynthesis